MSTKGGPGVMFCAMTGCLEYYPDESGVGEAPGPAPEGWVRDGWILRWIYCPQHAKEARPPRKMRPYSPPRVSSEDTFEVAALGCTGGKSDGRECGAPGPFKS